MPVGGKRAGAGRKTVSIPVDDAAKLAAYGCTNDEIGAWFGVTGRTIENRMKIPAFRDAVNEGRLRGYASVRRKLFIKATEEGDLGAIIWYSKQYMGQRDVTPLEISGPAGGPIESHVRVEDARDRLKRALDEGAERLKKHE